MRTWLIGLRIFIALSLLTGLAYPFLMTGVGEAIFKRQVNGSLLERDGQVVGSELLAQKFTKKTYFWSRSSASDYSGTSASASNQAVANETLLKAVAERKAQGLSHDMLYASGSGLDPHISPEAALDQVDRISVERKLSASQRDVVLKLIKDYTEGRQWGFLGEPRVNVLKLNAALDGALDKSL
ncbi:potassium-transporting ATPase subunit KdpC [Bdellovibrio sp. NC01]|uniref:potassium-transporting ATPase subunit KdpC n=1 Tax=Bdellovibrio sp. NC01 TaxID=2220073 RepID=UPI001157879D|nr:potassium-transporting ATPase subunit KdpC [Bdellovibrio sp. NC01]QDK37597.1 potassium-transporting ATPase subunit C [Bdellovibrio sp. NC01]